MRVLIHNGKVICDCKKKLDKGCVLIEDNKIIKVEKEIIDDSAIMIDAKGNYIVPALLDTHTHGALGYDFNTCTMDDINKIGTYSYQEGVSGFMASLVSESHEDTKALLKNYEQSHCRSLLGIHLEGPYMNVEKKAVMKEACLRNPNLKELKEYLKMSSKIKSMTLAPELPDALEMIEYGSKHNIVMNIGHSDGCAQDVLKAEKVGAQGVTHLYNAMSQHEHRNPGIVTGAILSNLYCELIVDGFHVHEDIVKATYKMLGKERIILISDANPCKGLAEGEYTFSGKNVVIRNQEATVKETGRIAGSTLSMQKACQNMMKYCNASVEDCVQMASENPSLLYKLNKGVIKMGYDADILIVNKNFEILTMVHDGQIKNTD